MLNKLVSNPFRILGVYSNARPAEIVSNCDDMEAYLSIGQSVSFDLDLNNIMPEVERSVDSVSIAKKQINLPLDKLKYALFWFVKDSSSTHALNYLKNGDFANANAVFEIEDAFSTCINQAVMAMLQEDLGTAISYTTDMIHNDELRNSFVSAICGSTFLISEDEMAHLYIDTLLDESNASDLMDLFQEYGTSEGDDDYLKEKAIGEPISRINAEIAKAKAVKRNDADANYNAGIGLMNNTKNDLEVVNNLSGISDMKYQILANDLANTILQCSINFFNDSEDDGRIEKALALMEYAGSIALGRIIKERCIDTAVKANIVFVEEGEHTVDKAISFMKSCRCQIIAIKEWLEVEGSLRDYYINVSTQVVNVALSTVIEDFNHISEQVSPLMNNEATRSNAISRIVELLKNTWKAFLMMECFEMESQFKVERFATNKDAIANIIRNFGGEFVSRKSLIHFSSRVNVLLSGLGLPYTRHFSFEVNDYIYPEEFHLCTDKEFYDYCSKISYFRLHFDTNSDTFHFLETKTRLLVDLLGLNVLEGNLSKNYDLYLKLFPCGRYVQEAQRKYEDAIANECYSVRSCEEYLNKFPNGRHIDVVFGKKDDFAFRDCSTIEGFNRYIEEYPNGNHRQEAIEKIQEIQDFNDCRGITDLKLYLVKYPSGFKKRDALNKIDDMSFELCSTKKEYKKYLEDFPQGRHKDEAIGKINEGCYIATMCYGDYDHPQVMVLRDFRDSVLLQHDWGQSFVRFYYRNSPNWVEHLKGKRLINAIIRKLLDKFIILYKYVKK